MQHHFFGLIFDWHQIPISDQDGLSSQMGKILCLIAVWLYKFTICCQNLWWIKHFCSICYAVFKQNHAASSTWTRLRGDRMDTDKQITLPFTLPAPSRCNENKASSRGATRSVAAVIQFEGAEVLSAHSQIASQHADHHLSEPKARRSKSQRRGAPAEQITFRKALAAKIYWCQ